MPEMGLHNKHAWNSWQSEERQHSSRHAPQVPIEQKITQGGRKIGVASWLSHFGGQVGLCLVKLNTHRPSAKPGHSQGYTLQERDRREAKQGPLHSSKGPQRPAPEISHEVGQAPRDATDRGSQHDGCGGGSLHPNLP